MPTNRYQFKDEKGEHMHLLDGRPLIGTSTVTKIIAKPLTWWAAGLAVKQLGWLNPKEHGEPERLLSAETMQNEIVGMPPEEYLTLLDKAYAAHSKELKLSASKGTDMHAELEKYGLWRMNPKNESPDFDKIPFIHTFHLWALDNIEEFIVAEGHCYEENLWTGGITDAVVKLKDGTYAILDYKSSKDAYESQFIQVAGYDLAQMHSGIVDKDGNALQKPIEISRYIVIPFGAPTFNPVQRVGVLESYREGFRAAVKLHKLINVE